MLWSISCRNNLGDEQRKKPLGLHLIISALLEDNRISFKRRPNTWAFVVMFYLCYWAAFVTVFMPRCGVTCRIKSLDRKRSHSSFCWNLTGTIHFFRSKFKWDFILLMLQLSRPRIVLWMWLRRGSSTTSLMVSQPGLMRTHWVNNF